MIWISMDRGQSGGCFQWYAAVHCSTCEACLQRHGEIFQSSAAPPPLHEGCRCHILKISPEELEFYRERSERMREKASRELERRRLFHQAVARLDGDFTQSENLFKQSVQSDIYLEEIEQLCREHKNWLATHPEQRQSLSKLFVRAYRMKFSLDKYKDFAEGMKYAQERYGIERIRELFA